MKRGEINMASTCLKKKAISLTEGTQWMHKFHFPIIENAIVSLQDFVII